MTRAVAFVLAAAGGWIIGYTPGWSAIVGGLLLAVAGFAAGTLRR